MLSENYILDRLHRLPHAEQVQLLLQALDHLREDPRRTNAECIAQALRLPLFPRVERIDAVDGYRVTVTFGHGEQRRIDFRELLRPGHRLENELLTDEEKFRAVEVIDGALAWPHVGIPSKDAEGKEQFAYYDVDPGVLYEESEEVGVS